MTFKRAPFKIRDKRKFLMAAMERLSGSAHISFEGNLSACNFAAVIAASERETATLKRNTLWPKQDFVVLPLRADNIRVICSAIGGTIPKAILHIQIEKDGELALGVYDNFQKMCFGTALDTKFFDQLGAEVIVRQTESRQR